MNRFPGFDMHLRLNGIGTASQEKWAHSGEGAREGRWWGRGVVIERFCRNWQLIGTCTQRSLRSAWWPLKRRRFHFINVCRLKARERGRKDGAEGGCYSENVLLISVICLRCEKEGERESEREDGEGKAMRPLSAWHHWNSTQMRQHFLIFILKHDAIKCKGEAKEAGVERSGAGRGGAAGNVSLCWCGKMLPMIAQKTNKTDATQLRSNE